MSTLNFAPPTNGLYPGQEEAAAAPPPADEPSGPLTAAQRLAALKAKLADARKTNHKAVVEEDRREKLGPEGLRDEAKEKSYERQKKEVHRPRPRIPPCLSVAPAHPPTSSPAGRAGQGGDGHAEDADHDGGRGAG